MRAVAVILIFCHFAMSQVVTSSSNAFTPLQRSFDIALSSNTFHSAKVASSFGFDIGVSHQFVQFPSFKDPIMIDNKKVDQMNLRTMRASIDLPISLQIGIHLNLPSYKVRDYDTNLLGFFAKLQFDQLISDKLPYTSLQFNSSRVEIGSFFTSRTDSYQLQFSTDLLLFHVYTGFVLNRNTSEFTFNETRTFIQSDRTEFYYRAGASIELLFFNIYAETSINQEMDYKNISIGASIKI